MRLTDPGSDDICAPMDEEKGKEQIAEEITEEIVSCMRLLTPSSAKRSPDKKAAEPDDCDATQLAMAYLHGAPVGGEELKAISLAWSAA